MKQMRKVFALIMALAIVLSLAVSVSADSITINGAVDGATYKGYQILNLSAGLKSDTCHDNESEHDASCYNLAYSVNPKYQTILATITGKTTDTDIRNYISAMAKDSDEIRAFADAVYAAIKAADLSADMTTTTGTFADSQQGYWLIEEIMPSSAAEEDHSLVMLTTMGIRDITVNTKRDNVTLEKEIYHDDAASWEIVGDDQIGDTVNFHTVSHVPDTDGFEELFTYVIHDKMSEGLTSNVVTGNTNGDVKITVNGVGGAELAAAYYNVYAGTDANGVVLGQYTNTSGDKVDKKFNCTEGCDFHVVINIKKALTDKVVDDDDMLYVAYSAVLNENAQILQTGAERENNQAHVEYSNNPYDESETTHTPDDQVFEYTFKLDVLKTDATTGHQIQNAKFVLSKDGTTLGNLIDKNGNGNIDVDTDPAKTEETNLYRFIRQTKNIDGVDRDTYTIAPADFTESKLQTGQTLVYVIEAGNPIIMGMDDGTDYYLYEIKAPDGYNPKYTPTRIKLFVEYNSDGSLKAGFPKVQVDSKEQSSTLQVTIENNTGTIMPSTGGIGTTLFYVIGGLMAACAAVLLVTKKRMTA